jgi:hypothetical protein
MKNNVCCLYRNKPPDDELVCSKHVEERLIEVNY